VLQLQANKAMFMAAEQQPQQQQQHTTRPFLNA
jgi:hypothetical protein